VDGSRYGTPSEVVIVSDSPPEAEEWHHGRWFLNKDDAEIPEYSRYADDDRVLEDPSADRRS